MKFTLTRWFPAVFGIPILVCFLKTATANDELNQQLWDAAQVGKTAIVESLLKKGADINCIKSDATPIMTAAMNCKTDTVNFLLQRNATLHHLRRDGSSILYITCDDIFKVLIEKKTRINTQDKFGETVLHKLVEKGNTDLVSFLLEHGADMDLVSLNKETAYDIANKLGLTQISSMLEKAVADPILVLRREITRLREHDFDMQIEINALLEVKETIMEKSKSLLEELTLQMDKKIGIYKINEDVLKKLLSECKNVTSGLKEEFKLLESRSDDCANELTKKSQENAVLKKNVQELQDGKSVVDKPCNMDSLKAELDRKLVSLENRVVRRFDNYDWKLMFMAMTSLKSKTEV